MGRSPIDTYSCEIQHTNNWIYQADDVSITAPGPISILTGVVQVFDAFRETWSTWTRTGAVGILICTSTLPELNYPA